MVFHLHAMSNLGAPQEMSVSPLRLRQGLLALLKERHVPVNLYKLQKKVTVALDHDDILLV